MGADQYDLIEYDTRGRLKTSSTKNSSHSSLRSRTYTYDNASQMLTANVDGITTEYDYDDDGPPRVGWTRRVPKSESAPTNLQTGVPRVKPVP
ncbi:MAG TPA: hypothetical protein PKA27_05235 [Fimbriimonadaceae bacterium]|nr:hypothetical protein [Fimbriimonadaceae bacterium]